MMVWYIVVVECVVVVSSLLDHVFTSVCFCTTWPSNGAFISSGVHAFLIQAFAGDCQNGALIEPQSARTQENHCGSCNDGYVLNGVACEAI